MPDIIAHRGACGYLPEHTLAAKALAYAMGADFLEQDVVATRDDKLVVLHDIHLDRVTDVAARFPGRAREDGRYYVRDFDLDELRTLNVTERLDADGLPVYPGRFPPGNGRFGVHTLAEELEFVSGLNRASGGTTGVYPEIKRPAWHREEGIDLAAAMLDVLAAHGYEGPDDPVFVQCFDALEVGERPLQTTRFCAVRPGWQSWRGSQTRSARGSRSSIRPVSTAICRVPRGSWSARTTPGCSFIPLRSGLTTCRRDSAVSRTWCGIFAPILASTACSRTFPTGSARYSPDKKIRDRCNPAKENPIATL